MAVRKDAALNLNSLYIAVSTVSFAGISLFFYRTTARSSRSTSFLVPAVCGSISAVTWHFLFTKPINNGQIYCAACASTRGAALAILTGCILPSFTVACVRYNWKPSGNFGHGAKQLRLFVKYCMHPYISARPHILGLGGLQAILGYCLASWQYNGNFKRRKV